MARQPLSPLMTAALNEIVASANLVIAPQKSRPPSEDLQNATAKFVAGEQLSERDRAILKNAIEPTEGISRKRGAPVKDPGKKQAAAFLMATHFIPERVPDDEDFEWIAETVGLTIDVVKHVYRARVLLGHQVSASLIGERTPPAARAINKSRKKKQSDK